MKNDTTKKITVPSLISMHRRKEPITMLTAYDASFARIIDTAGVETILVGDSLGMVIQGHDSTLPVTLDEIIYHTKCVTRATKRALVIADLPFMSYQSSTAQAMLSAGRAMKEGSAGAVKLEGGLEMADTVRIMVSAGIPVIAHIGLKPQSVNVTGGYKICGKTKEDASRLLEEAKAFESAGAFALVLEGVAMETASKITSQSSIPTIGIASGPNCSGQVLVIYDLIGLDASFYPKFLKKYVDGHGLISAGVKQYIHEVKSRKFPTEEHGFNIS